jgi:hypothetical protein
MLGRVMLTPNFHAMPTELCSIPRWVVWKDAKVPYCATAANGKASVTNASTWSSLLQAQAAYEEGGYLGVGFVLSGDGIVGVDLDKCVHSGEPEAAAIDLLNRVGCQYIELSPSGTGLRGFGYGDPIKGTRGTLGGVRVELYAAGRYLTVTGHIVLGGPLVNLPGFAGVADAVRIRPTEEVQKSSEVMSSVFFCRGLQFSSVGDLHDAFSSVGWPPATVPAQHGDRNQCLFALARYLRGKFPHATREELRGIVARWHSQYVQVIGTQDLSATLTDFFRGHSKVRQPHGEVMQDVISRIDVEAPLPIGIEALCYGRAGNRLVRVCAALQAHEGETRPFFLSARKAGEVLGVHFVEASKMMAALVGDGVLKLVSQGAGRVASRYRFVWP